MKKEKFSSRCLQFGFIAGLAFLLFGCSDGGSYEPAASVSASGTVAQGKVVNAKVCADMNYNNSCDEGEPFAISSADGSYNIANIPAGTPYQLITEGGFDSLTMAAALPMKAPSGASNITPLTTLVVESANPAAMIAILNNLSGGQGYDIDISTASMPPAFLALAKSVEKVLETLATYGLSSPADQALIFKDIAAAIQSESTNNVSGDLGVIFETAATNIAARDFVAFSVTDIPTFASDIGALATAVEDQVNLAVVGGVVVENQALQEAIDDPAVVTIPVLPVGSVSLSAAMISILDGANNPITSVSNLNNNFADLAVAATDFAKVNVSIEGQNSFSSVTENYSLTSFNLTVSDTLSNRSLQVIVSGVNVAVSDIGAVTLTFGVSPSLELRGINSDGSVVVQKTRSVGNLVTIIGGDVIEFDVNLLKAEIESTAGAVGTIGTYSVIATIIGAPGVPASVGLTLN